MNGKLLERVIGKGVGVVVVWVDFIRDVGVLEMWIGIEGGG